MDSLRSSRLKGSKEIGISGARGARKAREGGGGGGGGGNLISPPFFHKRTRMSIPSPFKHLPRGESKNCTLGVNGIAVSQTS